MQNVHLPFSGLAIYNLGSPSWEVEKCANEPGIGNSSRPIAKTPKAVVEQVNGCAYTPPT